MQAYKIKFFQSLRTLLLTSLTLYANASFSGVVDTFKEKANQGDAEAQFYLGSMYELGKDVPQNYQEAISWYTKAAEQENLGAINNLGAMYGNGKVGFLKDYDEALKWITKAAEQGNPVAERNLGLSYLKDKGVPKDYGQAIDWYTKAAYHNDHEAQRELSLIYSKGLGVPKNNKEACIWAIVCGDYDVIKPCENRLTSEELVAAREQAATRANQIRVPKA